MNEKKIFQGAEATIIFNAKENTIIKKRLPKSYRLPLIDEKLILSRTKRESRIIQKLHEKGIAVPKVLAQTKDSITMTYIQGEKVRDILDKKKHLGKDIGLLLASIHNQDIIHGDLTTANMIYSDKMITLIDFGLSFVSKRIEDKAVDIHLLKQALESYHATCFESVFADVVKTYAENAKNAKEVLQRFEIVSKRGKNKQ